MYMGIDPGLPSKGGVSIHDGQKNYGHMGRGKDRLVDLIIKLHSSFLLLLCFLGNKNQVLKRGVRGGEEERSCEIVMFRS